MVLDLVISRLAITLEPDAPNAAVTIFQAAPLPGLGPSPHRPIGRISMTAPIRGRTR